VHLALAAMVFRVLLPSGWMPGPSLARGIPIVMCTMDGPVKTVMPIDGKPDPAKKTHNVCPFGAAPHFAIAIPLLVQGAPSAWAYSEVERLRAPVRAARHHSPQSPRAPPLAA
jgi:hypothetical protein